MTLTVAEAKSAKAGEKNFALADSGGLFFLLTKSGAKSRRYEYRSVSPTQAVFAR
ncbi:hypothetical protein [Sphingomonas oligophenolica]|uniref:hypothetical protein n=1 Tax=Sphingomonas oligophenolica TaxID=301154 RepID=UPI0031DCCD2C